MPDPTITTIGSSTMSTQGQRRLRPSSGVLTGGCTGGTTGAGVALPCSNFSVGSRRRRPGKSSSVGSLSSRWVRFGGPGSGATSGAAGAWAVERALEAPGAA